MRLNTVLASLLLILTVPAAQAAVLSTDWGWSPNNSGYAVVRVCIHPESSTSFDGRLLRLAPGTPLATKDGSHQRAPFSPANRLSLEEMLAQTRQILGEQMESGTGLRFIGFYSCIAILNSPTKAQHVALLIKDGPGSNQMSLGKDGYKSMVSLYTAGASFNRGICEGNRYCFGEYVAHEFGHAVGFRHEQRRTDRPAGCVVYDDQNNVDYLVGTDLLMPDPTSGSYPAGSWPLPRMQNRTVYLGSYNRQSVMAYGGGHCAETREIRFGSPVWQGNRAGNTADMEALKLIYPPPATRATDIGVLAGAGTNSCEGTTPVTFYIDAEDNNPESRAAGWTGNSRLSDTDVYLQFCRADGALFQPIAEPYAVLKLGAQCPAGSYEFSVQMDDEDLMNQNFIAGRPGPNEQTDGAIPNWTRLHLCVFPAVANSSARLPQALNYSYGVFGRSPIARDSGELLIDNEDKENTNRISLLTPLSGIDTATAWISLSFVVGQSNNTLFRLRRVK